MNGKIVLNDKKMGQNNLDKVLEKAAEFANKNKNFILSISQSPLYNDEPKLFAYSAMYKLHRKQKHDFDYSYGVSFDKKIALMRVLGEGLERYCLDNFKIPIEKIASTTALDEPHLNPPRVSSFSKKQLQQEAYKQFRFTGKTKFQWTSGFSLNKNKKILIPAQLVSFDFDFVKEPMIASPISTGVAAGSSLEDAIYRAASEIVERDSFMISYLNMLPSPKVNLQKIKDKRVKHVLATFDRYMLELVVLDITTDLGIPAYAAITLDRTNLGPAVSVGLKAGFNRLDCILGAIEESLMTRAWVRDKFVYVEPHHKNEETIQNIEDRAFLWFSPNMIEKLNFWLKSDKNIDVTEYDTPEPYDNLERVMKILIKRDIELMYVDITNEKMKQYGFTIVRVIIPELQPLYLNDHYPYLGKKRLYSAPVTMGYSKQAKKEEQLNKVSHPFL